jgi:hypothetical protein
MSVTNLQPREGQSSRATERYARWFPVAIAVLALLPFLPLLTPNDRVIDSNEYCDYASFYLPIREFARDEFTKGRFPLWIPWLGCGMPLHASQQATLCYPLMTPFTVLLRVNLGMRAALFGHLALCFAGQYWLARSLGASRGAASFAAVVPTQSAYLVAHLMAGHVNHVVAFGLTPWFFLALVHLLRDPTARGALFLAIAGAFLIVGGHPQPTYYAALFGLFWWTASLIAGTGARHRLRCIAWTAIAAAVAIAISTVQLLPTLELLRDNGGATDRGTAAYASSFALDALDLIHFLSPNLRGNPFAAIPDYPGFSFFHERAGYVGLIPWSLGLLALARSSPKGWEWGAAAMILLAMVISLGVATPLFEPLGKLLPGLYYFRCPGRVLSIATILVGLLAARGLDFLLRKTAEARFRNVMLLVVAGTIVSDGVAYLTISQSSYFSWTAYRNFARLYLTRDLIATMAFGLGTGLFMWSGIHFGRIAPRRTLVAMLALLLADLGFNNASNFRLHEPANDVIPREVMEQAPSARFVEVRQLGRLLTDDVRYSKAVPLAIAHNRGMVGSNDGGVLPGSTERLFRAMESNTATALAASACNYEYLTSMKSWVGNSALARCRFLSSDDARLSEVSLADLTPGNLATAASSTAVQPRIEVETPQRLVVELDPADSGLLVLADTHYPGWKCLVDGKASPIVRVHGVFRGVGLGPGRHRVEFAYRPASFWWGWRVSLIGVCAAAFLTIVHPLSRKVRCFAR